MIRVGEEFLPKGNFVVQKRGRPPLPKDSFWKAFLCISMFQTTTVTNMLEKLRRDANMIKICGFTNALSPASFSRRMVELVNNATMTQVLNRLVTKYHEGRIIGHISRDSTAIEAR
jgi:hypothetical protein